MHAHGYSVQGRVEDATERGYEARLDGVCATRVFAQRLEDIAHQANDQRIYKYTVTHTDQELEHT